MSPQERLGFVLDLTRADITRLSDEYTSNKEEMEKEEAAFAAGKRISMGDSSRANLMAIVRWKSARSKTLVDSNGDDEINDALRLAVNAKTPRAAVAVLCGLRGVDVPVASAILTTINPKSFTVIDVRALQTLGIRKSSLTVGNYSRYLKFCLHAAASLDVPLRNLDRALWQKSKDATRQSRGRPSN
jgi:hypothetical protein